MTNINFDVTKEEMQLISKIGKRALQRIEIRNLVDSISLNMDITATHKNGNPLRLNDFLNADDFNFFHDIYGILNHLNRETGKLENCFSPRFSK
jgi:hypothetical protein